ncbi:GNAT family N-acetyltransferase [uncultured Cohaesibacter sp.]|uniref:GNAT family N-acetyltransferase n=1 Tax=uncultured Cohaesibacter sp. TaxID=1002546 RepID=UPI002931864B|nr:GNAT family N-acetyltransferase [uncultured Cohaesibacter sp.]
MLLEVKPKQSCCCQVDHFDNPFVQEVFVRAGEGRVTAGKIHIAQAGGYRFPFEIFSNAASLGARVARFWAHGYGPVGGAFWDPDNLFVRNEKDFCNGLDHLAQTSGVDVLLWPYFPIDTSEYRWLSGWVKNRLGEGDMSRIVMSRLHERAFMQSDPSAMEARCCGLSLSRNKRRTTGRQERRLKELGSLRFESTAKGLGHGDALEQFFKVEASGWKGLSGTALAANPDMLAFARDFMPDLLAAGRLQIDMLMLEDRCISALASFRAGNGLFTWKTGMDEVYKRYSPGVQILLEVSRQVMANPDVDYIDSLADSGHPVAEHIWSGRRRLAVLFVPLTEKGRVACRGMKLGYQVNDTARQWAKRLLGRV